MTGGVWLTPALDSGPAAAHRVALLLVWFSVGTPVSGQLRDVWLFSFKCRSRLNCILIIVFLMSPTPFFYHKCVLNL